MYQFIIGLSLLLLSQSALANTLYCSNTGRYISTGVSKQQAIAICGQPQQRESGLQKSTQTVDIEQWFYEFTYGTQVARVVVTLEAEKIIDISLNGQSVNSLSLCDPSFNVSKNDSANILIERCGNAPLKNRSQKVAEGGDKEVELWTYKFNEYQPPVYFKFEKDILTEIIQ